MIVSSSAKVKLTDTTNVRSQTPFSTQKNTYVIIVEEKKERTQEIPTATEADEEVRVMWLIKPA